MTATATKSAAKTATNRDRILDAANRLFCQKGFHGTATREVAELAGVSLGNIYNHFKGKEELFAALLARYEAEYFRPDQPLALAFAAGSFPDNIEAIGRASGETIRRFPDYILLIYVDVVEFKGAHIGKLFREMRARYQGHVKAAGTKVASDVDPVAAMMMVTLSYFNYFTVEKIFGVKNHFGMSDEDVVKTFARIFRQGVAR
jgi:AcrR family transcriptional regulator